MTSLPVFRQTFGYSTLTRGYQPTLSYSTKAAYYSNAPERRGPKKISSEGAKEKSGKVLCKFL